MKVRMKRATRILGLAVLGLCFVGLSMSQANKSKKGREFSNKDVQGNYGFSLNGDAVAGPIVGPIAGVGQISADGDGNATAVRTLNVGGVVVLRQTAEGTIHVNPDGTGTSTFLVKTIDPTGFPDAVETFDFVIVDKGKELKFIGTTLGVVARGVSRRQ